MHPAEFEKHKAGDPSRKLLDAPESNSALVSSAAPATRPPRYIRAREAARFLQSNFGFGSTSSLAKERCLGGGCPFHKIGRLVVYTEAELTAWATAKISKALASTSEAA